MTFDNLLLERDGAVGIVTINRPQVLDVFNFSTIDDLIENIGAPVIAAMKSTFRGR